MSMCMSFCLGKILMTRIYCKFADSTQSVIRFTKKYATLYP